MKAVFLRCVHPAWLVLPTGCVLNILSPLLCQKHFWLLSDFDSLSAALLPFRAVFEVFSSQLSLEFLKACSPTVPKTCAPLEPQHHVHMNQKTVSLFLASFSLVHISLVFSLSIVILLSFLPCFFNSSSVFPDVLSLAGRKRYLTTYP